MSDLDAAGITRLLEALDSELAARGTAADVYVVGGAAIARKPPGCWTSSPTWKPASRCRHRVQVTS